MDKEKEVKSFVDDFEEWNNVTGALAKGTGWYYECLSILEDADKALKAERAKREEAEKALNNSEIYKDLLGRIEQLKEINALSEPFKRILNLESQLSAVEEKRIAQLTAISVSSIMNTPKSFADAEISKDNMAYSIAYSDVRAAIKREMELIDKLAAANAKIVELEKKVEFAERATCLTPHGWIYFMALEDGLATANKKIEEFQAKINKGGDE